MLVLNRLVLSFTCLCTLFGYVSESRADRDEIKGIIKDYPQILDGGQYQNPRWDKPDYWDCNGYSIRACQVLIRFGHDCQIAVNNGHAFVYVPGAGYIEPQTGGAVDPRYLGGGIKRYPIDQYIATYDAAACQTNFPSNDPYALPDDGAETPPLAGGAQPPQDTGVGQVGNQEPITPVVPPVATPGLFQHNGYYYECPSGMILVVYGNGALLCQASA